MNQTLAHTLATCTHVIMYEIEAKVPLKKADVQRLRKELPKIAKLKGKSIKKDTYFGSTSEYLFRLRDKNGKGILNLKYKKVEGGVEVNREVELPVSSITKVKGLLKKLKISTCASKKKISETYKYKTYQIELNKVEKLGYFLEIETIIQKKSDIPRAKKALREMFSRLGFSSKDFEKKYYLELLAEKRKN